jgi:hypothetical protein
MLSPSSWSIWKGLRHLGHYPTWQIWVATGPQSPQPHNFDAAFSKAFFDPDEQQAAEHKITSLIQTSTTATYATKFCTILMSLDWNDATLQA